MSDTPTAYQVDESLCQRFMSRVAIADDGCHVWTGALFDSGYGVFAINRRAVRAHRVAVVLSGRVLAQGQVVRHECDNRRCVNPAHLIVGTQLENVRDREQRGRGAKGERQGSARLTREQVLEIRASQESLVRCAFRFGVCRSLVQQIRQRKAWKHV